MKQDNKITLLKKEYKMQHTPLKIYYIIDFQDHQNKYLFRDLDIILRLEDFQCNYVEVHVHGVQVLLKLNTQYTILT